LGVAREEALGFSVTERVDHLGSVFFATGIIQVSDVVTHALVALAQAPGSSDASDDAVVAETIRLYPVNSSITRRPDSDVALHGRLYRRGEPITVVPQRLEREPGFDAGRDQGAPAWSFGVGPRACPARRVATALASAILGQYRQFGVQIEPGYPHQRSLAVTVRARIGLGEAPATTARLRRALAFGRFAAVCAVSYPAAFLLGLPDLVEEIAARH
jgi:cytochrome P450